MPRPPKQEDSITVQLRGESAIQFREYMRANGHGNATEAFREIMAVYFASTPIDGVLKAARENVTNNMKHWMMTRMRINLEELQAELEQQVTALEKSGWGR